MNEERKKRAERYIDTHGHLMMWDVFKAAPNHELGGDKLCVRCGGELYDLDRHYTYEEARARRSNIY